MKRWNCDENRHSLLNREHIRTQRKRNVRVGAYMSKAVHKRTRFSISVDEMNNWEDDWMPMEVMSRMLQVTMKDRWVGVGVRKSFRNIDVLLYLKDK